jgi:glycosyltransferase involved in cell wall biosynthesis
MKIGIDARMYGPKTATGLGAYIQELIKHIKLLDDHNQYVIFMNNPEYENFKETANVKKVLVDCPWYSFAEQVKLPFIFWKHKLDVLHVPHFNVPILYPRKMIVTIHDITPVFFPGPKVKKSFFRKMAYSLVLKTALKRSKKIITISNHTKKLLVENLGAKEDKIEVVYLGLNTLFESKSHQPLSENLKNKLGISKNYLLYVGVWRDHKNLPTLILAYNQLRQAGNYEGQLVLAGKPDDRYPEIMQTIKQSAFVEDIILPGFIDEQDLGYLYAGADIFILPSFHEGFGLVVLEAAACQTPVVASSSTSVPEIMGIAGCYFNPKEPEDLSKVLALVLSDQVKYQEMQNIGLKLTEKYNWRECVTHTIKIYEKIKSVV